MTAYNDENLLTFFCVGWNFSDDWENARWMFFDNRDECVEFAQNKKDSETPFLWMAELGRYINKVGNPVNDWVYSWWYGQGIEAGPLPNSGYGVPETYSWGNHVEYVPLVPAPLHQQN